MKTRLAKIAQTGFKWIGKMVVKVVASEFNALGYQVFD